MSFDSILGGIHYEPIHDSARFCAISRADALSREAPCYAEVGAVYLPRRPALWTQMRRARKPCVTPPCTYVPTTSPRALMPNARVTVAPGKSIVV
jgi:hypothetical protein